VIDASSCTLGLLEDVPPHLSDENARRHAELEILDSIEWAHDRLLPRLTVTARVATATVHPPCSTRHLGLNRKLAALAEALADDVTVPVAATCCGFAGDRGLLHPELAAAATRDEAAELEGAFETGEVCGGSLGISSGGDQSVGGAGMGARYWNRGSAVGVGCILWTAAGGAGDTGASSEAREGWRLVPHMWV